MGETDEYAIEEAWSKYREIGLESKSEASWRGGTRTSIETQYSRRLPADRQDEQDEDDNVLPSNLDDRSMFENNGAGLGMPFAEPLLGRTAEEKRGRSGKAMAPQIDLPQRVGHPPNVNAPTRTSGGGRDDRILEVFGSQRGAEGGAKQEPGAGALRVKGLSTCKAATQNNNSTLKVLKDLEILAKTCRRAGKDAQEAQALYCRGVHFDNLERWSKAIESYEAYLKLCQKMGDRDGANVAFNCCGVAFFNLAVGGSEAGNRAVGLAEYGAERPWSDASETDLLLAASQDRAEAAAAAALDPAAADPRMSELLKTSTAYHLKHFETSDEAGQFVALCNIGLCHSRLGDHSRAIDYQQQALRLAIELASPHGQSLAVGNLALSSAALGDWDTARACMDKHLHLVRDLQNAEAESLACQQLGQIANKYGNFQDATQYFEEARRIASSSGERGMLKLLNCNVGVAVGNLRMAEYMRQLGHACLGSEDAKGRA